MSTVGYLTFSPLSSTFSSGFTSGSLGAYLRYFSNPPLKPNTSFGWVKSFPVLNEPSPILKFTKLSLPLNPGKCGSFPTKT